MSESGGDWRWLRYGCFGCLGLVGLLVVVVGIGVITASVKARHERVLERTVSPDLESAPRAPALPGEPEGPGEARAGLPVSRGVAPGEVILDLRNGSFTVEPTEAGEPLHVDARYDEKTYRLDESFESGDDGWTYRVGFRRTGIGWLTGLKELMGGTPASLHVYLPPDVELRLELSVEEGQAEAELGGLWLDDLSVELSRGEARLSFSEPLRQAARRASLRANMGGMEVREMGNASPRDLSVELGMGGLHLDLSGAWTADASIEITSHMAGGVVRLPEGVHFEGIGRSGVDLPQSPELAPPTLRFTVSSEMGEIQFVD